MVRMLIRALCAFISGLDQFTGRQNTTASSEGYPLSGFETSQVESSVSGPAAVSSSGRAEAEGSTAVIAVAKPVAQASKGGEEEPGPHPQKRSENGSLSLPTSSEPQAPLIPRKLSSHVAGFVVADPDEAQYIKTRTNMCGVCGRSFADRAALRKHWLVHVNVKPFQCLKCNKSYTQKAALQAHLHRYHSDKSNTNMPAKSLQCLCGKNYTHKRTLREHMDREHRQFPTPQRVHLPIDVFQCNICGRNYTGAQSLRSHLNRAHPTWVGKRKSVAAPSLPASKIPHCRICGKSGFSSLKILKQHLLRQHDTHHAFACECNRTFYFEAVYLEHLKTGHGPSPFRKRKIPPRRNKRGVWRGGNRLFKESQYQILWRWFQVHRSYPYPNAAEKEYLVRKSGLSRGQISLWFVNARQRVQSARGDNWRTVKGERGLHQTLCGHSLAEIARAAPAS